MKIFHHEKGRDPLYKIWNCIDGYMIIYMYSDGGSIVFQDIIYPITKGTLCFIGPDKQHYTMPDECEKYDRSKIYISDDKLHGILGSVSKNSSFYHTFADNSVVYAHIPPEHRQEIDEIFSSVNENVNSEDFCEEIFVCGFFRLMTYLKKYVVRQIVMPDDFISKSIDYINNNYAYGITLNDICEEIHMSKFYYCRKFKEKMGMTVMEYVLNTKIAAAKNYLISTDMSIGDISGRCGFSGISYFCQIFKQHTGMTANQYRKNSACLVY